MQAVKRVVAQNRLILSGTPIQNNIQELWALFDFLMPGFLGSQAAFNAQFGKALKSGRTSKTGSSEAQAGLLAMEGLHKQAIPLHPGISTLQSEAAQSRPGLPYWHAYLGLVPPTRYLS